MTNGPADKSDRQETQEDGGNLGASSAIGFHGIPVGGPRHQETPEPTGHHGHQRGQYSTKLNTVYNLRKKVFPSTFYYCYIEDFIQYLQEPNGIWRRILIGIFGSRWKICLSWSFLISYGISRY